MEGRASLHGARDLQQHLISRERADLYLRSGALPPAAKHRAAEAKTEYLTHPGQKKSMEKREQSDAKLSPTTHVNCCLAAYIQQRPEA